LFGLISLAAFVFAYIRVHICVRTLGTCSGTHPLTRAEDLMDKGAAGLHLAQTSVAFADYMVAARVYATALKGVNWFGDKLEDNSELAVADCLLGAGTAQAAMG